MSPTEPNHPSAENPKAALYEQMADAIENVVRPVGLHPLSIRFAEDPDDPDQKYIIASFMMGDLAFSDRVQNPEEESLKDTFTEISQDLLDQHIAEVQQQIRDRNKQQDGEQ